MEYIRKEAETWSPSRPIKVTVAGGVIDATQSTAHGKGPPVKWLDSKNYVNTNTGEIHEAEQNQTRAQSPAEVRRTFRRMRGLINANFFGDLNEIMITLTYAKNQQDTKEVYEDFRRFIQKAKRRLGEIKYLTALEPQERGAWHMHLLLKQLSAHHTYWPHEDIQDCWPHGFVWVTSLKNIDNIGAYLSAYLSNVPDPTEKKEADPDGSANVPKRVIKGARLHWYPRGTHIYRASQNLDKPIEYSIRPGSEEFELIVMGAEERYASTLSILDDDGNEVNKITHRQYVMPKAPRLPTDREHKPSQGRITP